MGSGEPQVGKPTSKDAKGKTMAASAPSRRLRVPSLQRSLPTLFKPQPAFLTYLFYLLIGFSSGPRLEQFTRAGCFSPCCFSSSTQLVLNKQPSHGSVSNSSPGGTG